jgi:hypothetical protein
VAGFDVHEYFLAVDAARQQRGLSWAGLTRELNAPFAHRADIPPIAASSLSGMRAKGGLNGNIVVHTLMWLGRAPEEFTQDHPVAAHPLPPLVMGYLPRWNTPELRSAIETQRRSEGLTWQQAVERVWAQGGLYSAGSLRNTSVGFPAVMGVLAWLERPAADFVHNVRV